MVKIPGANRGTEAKVFWKVTGFYLSYPPHPFVPHSRRPGKVQRHFQQGLSAGLIQNPVGGNQVQFFFRGDSLMGQELDQFVDLPQV